MQDNPFDERFMDVAWAGMKNLLDKEMPEKRKRRPLLWWWLLPIFLLTGIGVISSSNRWSPENSNRIADHKIPSPTIKEEAVQEIVLPEVLSITGNSSAFTSTIDQLDNHSIGIQPSKSISINPMNPFTALPERPATSIVVPVPDSLAGDSLQIPIAGIRLPVVVPAQAIAARPADYLEFPTDSFAFASVALMQPIKRTRQGRWSLWATTEALLPATNDNTLSVSAGLLGSVQYRRFSLSTGINYFQSSEQLQLHTSGSSDLLLDNNPEEAMDPNFSNNQPSNTGKVDYPSVIDIRRKQWNIPLVAAYHLNRRFKLEAGVNLGYLAGFDFDNLQEQTSDAYQRAFNMNDLATGVSAAQTSFNAGQALDRNWLLQPQLGIHYQLSNAWQAGLQYRMRQHILRGDIYNWKNESLQFSLRYKLWQSNR